MRYQGGPSWCLLLTILIWKMRTGWIILILTFSIPQCTDGLKQLHSQCQDGFFGYKCRFRCRCKLNEVCDKSHGNCVIGCRDKFWGPGCQLSNSCFYNGQMRNYMGTESMTNSSHTCQRWEMQVPHKHKYTSVDFPDRVFPKNYCRTTAYSFKPWCYTTEKSVRGEYCNISNCNCPSGRFASNCEKECHCEDQGESCDSILGMCKSGCAAGWTGYDCQTSAFVNVALKKPVNMSSQYNHSIITPLATKAVDGSKRAIFPNVMQTAEYQPYAWWWVDLLTQVQDATVKIFFRTDYIVRRNGVQLYTSMESFSSFPDGDLCHTFTGRVNSTDIPDVVNVTCNGTWRYLMVYTNRGNDNEGPVLDFGELEVLVCVSGNYGEDCNMSCQDRKCEEPSSCNHTTGKCDRGCQAGWMGTDCTKTCVSGNYGEDCNMSCVDHKCKESSSCNHTTGKCDTGCQNGWKGPDCTQPCVSGNYGEDCNMSCVDRKCKDSSSCNHTTGKCDTGCQNGWKGTDCTKICVSGNYGEDCKMSCQDRKCEEPSSCNHITGKCDRGCQHGWNGTDCTKHCTSGTYGVNCLKKCGHCKGTCNMIDGHCPGGCEEGYSGAICDVSTSDSRIIYVAGAAAACLIIAVAVTLLVFRWCRSKEASQCNEITQSEEMRGDAVPERTGCNTESDYFTVPNRAAIQNNDYDVIQNRVYENM